MAFHHIAFASRDTAATHAFYTDVMGFELVKVNVAETPEGGWAKHFFYDTGAGELLAFWELHVDSIGPVKGDISGSLGLPMWVNHLAFAARDLDELHARRDRWRASGYDVAEIDHGWCVSVYLTDPNGILVEISCTTVEFTDSDKLEAQRLLADPHPALEATPDIAIHHATAPAHA